MIDREELREYLNPIYDLERLVSRIANRTANPRDLIAFKNSLKMLEPISNLIGTFESNLMRSLYEQLDPLEDIYQLIEDSIVDDPPIAMKEAGLIKDGFNEQADAYRKAKTEGKSWLTTVETNEREKTGIKNLKVKFNKVFGYYLEVTNSFKDQVPDYFIRKQTLVNAERYITEELKNLEEVILGAEEKLCALEYDLFCEIRDKIASQISRIQESAKAVATLDVLSSLADVSVKNDYVKPKINTRGILNIKGGRHPVVEKLRKDELFIANDTYLDNSSRRVAIITGPNMAGKSTYMRQSALIVLMAQIGCFVPADSANISICDRIFTRVGASDDLASGQSTFMVEMTEVANILKNATKNSLLVLDEIGRGTSTYDGMSIAWAVIEYVSNARTLGAKTLFATHYHELTELEGVLPGVHNYCIAVKEKGDDIVFLRKIVKGGADKSYGIQVAKLAGVPDVVLNRAKQLVTELSDADITAHTRDIAKGSQAASSRVKKPDEVDLQQLTMFDTVKEESIIQEILDMNLTQMTPIDALNTLYRIQSKLKNRV
jgi:DNA mismatch repair protein MutS